MSHEKASHNLIIHKLAQNVYVYDSIYVYIIYASQCLTKRPISCMCELFSKVACHFISDCNRLVLTSRCSVCVSSFQSLLYFCMLMPGLNRSLHLLWQLLSALDSRGATMVWKLRDIFQTSSPFSLPSTHPFLIIPSLNTPFSSPLTLP